LFVQRYLGYFINSSVYHDQLLPHIVGTKVSSISKKSLNETFVLRPTIPEQEAIAEDLFDIDALITNLEKLIAKKKAIKQGAMQDLLTAKSACRGLAASGRKRNWESLVSSRAVTASRLFIKVSILDILFIKYLISVMMATKERCVKPTITFCPQLQIHCTAI
jgi:hypothetical protein